MIFISREKTDTNNTLNCLVNLPVKKSMTDLAHVCWPTSWTAWHSVLDATRAEDLAAMQTSSNYDCDAPVFEKPTKLHT